jgi:uncharacterized protein with FMN-binding domain
MKRAFMAIVATVTGLVMVLTFRSHTLGVAAAPSVAVSTATSSGGGGSSHHRSSATSKTKPKATVKATPASTTRTVTGNAVETMYGPVQVRITVKGGAITSATAVTYPTQDPRDAQINAYAIPVLNSEAAQADSANIDHVSGATYTSNGYIESLQSALDQLSG